MDILPQLILNSVIAGAIYALVAVGFNLIYGTVKFFDLGDGALTVVGGYAMFLFYKKLEFGLPVSVGLAILGAGLIGWLVNRLVYRRLRARQASGMVMLVASLGVFTLLQALLAIFFSSQFQTLSLGTSGSQVFEIFGAVITYTQITILASGLAIMGCLALLLKFTLFGKAITAVADDEEVAKIVGITTSKIIGGVFFVGSMIAGLAGLLGGFDTGIEPTMGLSLLLKGVIASIIGGIGNIYGG